MNFLYFEKQSKQEKWASVIRKFIKFGKVSREKERERERASRAKLELRN